MALTKITDHTARALSRVITKLRGTEFEGLIRAFTVEVQAAEDALFTLVAVIRDPSTAEGDCLDRLGAFVGAEVRGALTDAEYRLRVAAAIARNRASGTPEDLISVVIALQPALSGNLVMSDADVEGTGCATLKPGSYDLVDGYPGVSTAEAEELMRYLSRAAGVRVIYSYGPVPFDPDFAYDETLAMFDTAEGTFDNANQFAGSVDQNTRN